LAAAQVFFESGWLALIYTCIVFGFQVTYYAYALGSARTCDKELDQADDLNKESDKQAERDESIRHAEAEFESMNNAAEALTNLGFTGTIIGLIHAFVRIVAKIGTLGENALDNKVLVSAVAGGIAAALTTTLVGLVLSLHVSHLLMRRSSRRHHHFGPLTSSPITPTSAGPSSPTGAGAPYLWLEHLDLCLNGLHPDARAAINGELVPKLREAGAAKLRKGSIPDDHVWRGDDGPPKPYAHLKFKSIHYDNDTGEFIVKYQDGGEITVGPSSLPTVGISLKGAVKAVK